MFFSACVSLQNVSINGGEITLAADEGLTSSPQPGCVPHIPCSAGFCQNQGKCVDLWTEKICQCRPGFTGKRCELITMATFEDNAFLHFDGQGVISRLSLRFTTILSSAVLLYTVCRNWLGSSHLILAGGSSGKFGW